MQTSSNKHPYFATRSKLARNLARDLYEEICGTVIHLPIFDPWDGRPLLDALNEAEPGYLLEGAEVSRDSMEQAYHELDDEAKQLIEDDWERLINTLQVANEVTMTARECAFKIGQRLRVGGLEAFEEKTTEVIPSKPQPAKAVAREETETYARLAATALWKTAMRPWQAMMGGLIVAVVLLVSYALMDHVDAMTTPIAMGDVAPLEIEHTPDALPSTATPLTSHEQLQYERPGATVAIPLKQESARQDAQNSLDMQAPTNAKRLPQPEKPVQAPKSKARAHSTVALGSNVQHVILIPESATAADDEAITISIKPGIPRVVEGTTRATRQLTIPDISEFSLQLPVDPSLEKAAPKQPNRRRSLTVTWTDVAQ